MEACLQLLTRKKMLLGYAVKGVILAAGNYWKSSTATLPSGESYLTVETRANRSTAQPPLRQTPKVIIIYTAFYTPLQGILSQTISGVAQKKSHLVKRQDLADENKKGDRGRRQSRFACRLRNPLFTTVQVILKILIGQGKKTNENVIIEALE